MFPLPDRPRSGWGSLFSHLSYRSPLRLGRVPPPGEKRQDPLPLPGETGTSPPLRRDPLRAHSDPSPLGPSDDQRPHGLRQGALFSPPNSEQGRPQGLSHQPPLLERESPRLLSLQEGQEGGDPLLREPAPPRHPSLAYLPLPPNDPHPPGLQ